MSVILFVILMLWGVAVHSQESKVILSPNPSSEKIAWSWCQDWSRESWSKNRALPIVSIVSRRSVSLLRFTPHKTGAALIVTIWLKKSREKWTSERIAKCYPGPQKPIRIRRFRPRFNPYRYAKGGGTKLNQNIFTGIGRCAQVPQLKTYDKADGTTGYRCWFSLAITRLQDRGEKDRTKQRTNFISIVTWGDAAKRHAQYIGQGDALCVTGELVCESEKQADGSYREFTAVSARDIQYLGRALKNQGPEALNRTAENVSKRLNDIIQATAAMTAGEGAPVGDGPAPVDVPATSVIGGDNPFATA